MQVFRNISELSNLNKREQLSICLGFFDGVHLGHRVVVKNTVNLALQNNLKSAIVTFKEHPLCYLQNRTPQYIIPLHDRLKIFEGLGIDYVFLLDFDENTADILAIDYLENVLVKNLNPKFITTGFNHYFGANKLGDANFLRLYQETFSYRFFEIPPITYNNILISSTKIRQLINIGSVDCLKNLLGDFFYINGRVITGNRIGRTLSYPTANLQYPEDIIKVAKGVYAVNIEFDNRKLFGVANFGNRPTIGGKSSLLLEVHIFDFNENIYDKDIKVSFVKKLRDEKKFESLADLKLQLAQDEQAARKLFKL